MTHGIILAGGRGERLRPITDTEPKPTLKVGGVPAIGYAVRMLGEAGIRRAVATVRYRYDDIAEAIKSLSDCGINACGAGVDVDVDCYIELEMLGTSGSTRAALYELGPLWDDVDEVVVVSGDAVCDFDLRPAISYHRASGAAATLLLARSETPWLYGNVVLENENPRMGKIVGFREKPKDASPGALVNTGIYILSRRAVDAIPDGDSDFACDLFPTLMARGETLCGICGVGYWRDIGSPESLRLANFDAAKNRIRGVTASVSPTGAIVSPSCRVGMGSTLPGCLLLPDVTVGTGAFAEDAILCRGVTVGDNAKIGKGAVIGEGAVIMSGAVVGDGEHIPVGTVYDRVLV